jgi:anti-sigma regulatory factor (Ser/Thr protein kinase)
VPRSLSIPIGESNQVGEARRAAHRLGSEIGLTETALGNLSIIVTEAATNLYKHAKEGELILRQLSTGDSRGMEVLSVDRGPGMTEVWRCLEDGYSTTGTKGQGLGSIKRLASTFDIHSMPQGTTILAQIFESPAKTESGDLELGSICLPYPGETACGDAWALGIGKDSTSVIMADGLGHGVDAAKAADLALEIFGEDLELAPNLLLQRMHPGMRATRGAAVLILRIGLRDRKIICSGVGNITGGSVNHATTKSFVSLNGTIGHQAHRFQDFNYDWAPGALLVMHSDGLQTKWKLDAYPGLQMRHPSIIAAILYRDFRRSRDDVSVVVLRERTGTK